VTEKTVTVTVTVDIIDTVTTATVAAPAFVTPAVF